MGKKRSIRPSQIVPLSFDHTPEHDWTQEEAEELIKKWPDIPSKN